jgi:septin 3/9/12
VRSTTEIQTVSHVIEENGVRLRLNIVDTPGYGDQVNNDRCWDPIVKYIKDQHSAYLRKELTAQRERYIQDTRIHCCLFFIQPSGHALKPIDIVVLKKLSDVVNVVPVIAKSDSLTLEERSAFKERIKEEFAFHNLKMFPYDNDEFDEEERALNAQIKVCCVCNFVPENRLTLCSEHHPVRCCRIREVNHCWRQASPWTSKQMGSYQCGG